MRLEDHVAYFEKYATEKIANCVGDASPLELKLAHTHAVAANARQIADAEGFSPSLARMCVLSAIYHDISRFDQYLQFGTFKDSRSRNHGTWSASLLRTGHLLDDESPSMRRSVLIAIAVHNKLSIPSSLDGETLIAANVLRDADKLDIIRLMANHLSGPGPYNPTVVLSLPDDPDAWSEKVIACALSQEPASYGDLQSVNDFRVLLGTWFFAMNFPSSRALFQSAGHAHRLVSQLPQRGPYAIPREKLLAKLAGGDSPCASEWEVGASSMA